MHKRSLENTIYVLAAGAFGVFLRWLQLQLAFDENGLNGPHVFNWLVTIFLITAAVVFYRRTKAMLGKKLELPEDEAEALGATGKLHAILRWLAGGLMAVGGVLLIRGSETEQMAKMLRVMGILAIAAGLGYALLLELVGRELRARVRKLLGVLYLLPIVLLGVWLIYDYRANAINSVIWAFLVEVLAVSTLMIAFFRVAGVFFRQKDEKKLFFWLQYGIFMSIVVLADSRSTSMQVIFFSAGFLLALVYYILLGRLREKREEQESEPEPFDGGFETL